MTNTHPIPVPTIDVPRYRGSTVEGLLTWQPTSRTNVRRFGHWTVEVDRETGYRTIRHYSTWMLGIRMSAWGNGDGTGHAAFVDHTSTGHGSVSDQGMMNRLLRALGSDLYYSRRGGASIGEVA